MDTMSEIFLPDDESGADTGTPDKHVFFR